MSIVNEIKAEEPVRISTPEVSVNYGGEPNNIIASCAKEKGKFVIFEPGCGNKLSISLGPKDVWIGIDPDLAKGTRIKRGDNVVCETSRRFAVSGKLDELPENAFPDVVIMMAPNPDDINYHEYLAEINIRMKKDRTVLLAVLDTESYESQADPVTFEMKGYGLKLARKKFMETFGKDYDVEFLSTTNEKTDILRDHNINRSVHINSDFLAGKRKMLVVVSPKNGRK